MKYKPRGPLCVVKRVRAAEPTTATGIYLPNSDDYMLARFEIVEVGPDIKDLKVGDQVLAEDTFQALSKTEKELGLIHEKYIHMVYGE